jgi:hypothetical protein
MEHTHQPTGGIALNVTPLVAGSAPFAAAIVVDVDSHNCSDERTLRQRLRRVGMSPEQESAVFFLHFWDAEMGKFRLLIGVPFVASDALSTEDKLGTRRNP